jgi:hypothetical protein
VASTQANYVVATYYTPYATFQKTKRHFTNNEKIKLMY